MLRGLGAFIAGLFALFCLVAAVMPTDARLAQESLQNQQQILAGLRQMGRFTEDVRVRESRVPSTDELFAWMKTQQFAYRWFDEYKDDPGENRLGLAVLPTGEEFIVNQDSELDPADGHTYRIAFWNNWTHEYAPETGQHTLPTTLADYAPKWWKRMLFGLLATGLLVLAGKALGLLPQRKDKG